MAKASFKPNNNRNQRNRTRATARTGRNPNTPTPRGARGSTPYGQMSNMGTGTIVTVTSYSCQGGGVNWFDGDCNCVCSNGLSMPNVWDCDGDDAECLQPCTQACAQHNSAPVGGYQKGGKVKRNPNPSRRYQKGGKVKSKRRGKRGRK